jgi:aminoglycoside phosphotransferase family enzyme/predicted kinase
MQLDRLVEALSDPAAYAEPVPAVEVHHTHISVVFLAGGHAYKIKKPVNLGFLDFTTLDLRRHFCDEEVRLNRRLAPEVYLGVVPITVSGSGAKMEGTGEKVEWAVKMVRLPAEATLEQRLLQGEVDAAQVRSLAGKVASFHAGAERGQRIAAFGKFDVVARNARENFTQAAAQVGRSLTRAVFERLRQRTDETLDSLRGLIETRADRGVPRDTHGDLHLDHIYAFPDRPPPGDLLIIDCIEFNERFRFADPVADMAFAVMDFQFHGRRDLAHVFADEYFRASGDSEGRQLLPHYTAYRAAVRGKVEGFELTEKEIPEEERQAALVRARAHWLLALGELEPPDRKPCLVLVGGLPGTGKSTLARGLAEQANFTLIRSDVIRKQLAGIAESESGRAAFQEGIYTAEWRERTYAECLRQTETLLLEGQRVIVDATFSEESRRRAFVELAGRLAVPALFLVCRAAPEEIRKRLLSRRGDASDADWAVYEQAVARWEAAGGATSPAFYEISTDAAPQGALTQAVQILGTSL